MQGTQGRYWEALQFVAGADQGGQFADELLNACFDHVQSFCASEGTMTTLDQQIATLERFNAYLRRDREGFAEGLFFGTPEEVAAWAEDLAAQIVMNRAN
ncbi:MAG: hypothetical protein H6Q56_1348 [Deltaproteobacteria bacterium]|jgi:alkanesulfonate monooxygenase SsuD/methylene tetrahydromethanopterin reductase-like flavin-dependent oxidoreductase (luciferase family)|nr:hypothetical protein [Deltaproteobacteria bacterium]